MPQKQTTFVRDTGHKVIHAEVDQCPVCAEKDYIAINSVTGKIVCQSCGYDNSMSKTFKSPPLNL
jgi:Zn ribbon nucleic-acid-binding protein